MALVIKESTINRPPRICLYAKHGWGKSTFGSEVPDPVFLPTEGGLGSLKVKMLVEEDQEMIESYTQLVDALKYLRTQPHKYKSVVIDSIDWTEKLIFRYICQSKGIEDIAAIPYGRGYIMAENVWREIIDHLTFLNEKKNMMIVLLAHAKITRFEDPERDSYDKYNLDVQQRSAALISEFVDILGYGAFKVSTVAKDVGFGNTVVKAKSSGDRILCLEERASYTAKNRYGLPDTIFMKEGDMWNALYGELKKRIKKTKNKTKGNLKDASDDQKAQNLAKISTSEQTANGVAADAA